MSLARYGFLPWLRQGISKDINEPDHLSAHPGKKSRPTVDVSLKVHGLPVGSFFLKEVTGHAEAEGSDRPVYKKVQMVGPGDITGIKSEAIVKTEPLPGVGNFEPNYLPYIEFYEEDFPWRYTPLSEKDGKLRPWLVLVVLKTSEFERRFPPKAPLPAITNGKAKVAFPAAEEAWAWAHVHTNQRLEKGREAAHLREIVDENPNLASSRLLCPRKLEDTTRYTAFLLPAFEQGRLAGLGADNDRIQSESIQTPSWNHHKQDEFENLWPVYFEWEFQTSGMMDFEYLVRRIEAHQLEDPVGRRPVDMQAPGYTLSYQQQEGTLRVEGALQVIDADERRLDFLQQPQAQTFIEKLQELLNLNDPISSGKGDAPTADETLYADGDADDPIVTPPLYGQWHAGAERVEQRNSKPWFYELNLDPRNRIAAGFGTLVVRRNQDDYMTRAWEQAADILAAQDLIRRARFSGETAKRLKKGYFDGMSKATFSAFSSALHQRSNFSQNGQNLAVEKVVERRYVQILQITQQLKEELETLQQLETRLQQEEQVLQVIREDIEQTASAIEAKKAEIKALREEIEEQEKVVKEQRGLYTDKQKEVERQDAVVKKHEQEIKRLEKELKKAESKKEKAELEKQIEKEKDDEKKAKEKLEDLQKEEEDLKRKKEEEEAKLEQLKTNLDDENEELGRLKEKEKDLKRQEAEKEALIEELEAQIEAQKAEIRRLSRLRLPTSALRQEYRKVARANGPVARRAAARAQRADAVLEISKKLEALTDKEASPEKELAIGWDELDWGAEMYRQQPVEPALTPEAGQTDTDEISDRVARYMDANAALNQRLREELKVKTQADIPAVDVRTRALLTYPEFREATYEALAKISSELMLPNVQLIPMDTFSLLEVNQRFIEAYLLGLNHEMARELLWREFPTDQRGSYFRTFWDNTDRQDQASLHLPPDIELLTEMAGSLGQHLPGRRSTPPPTEGNPNVVFVIRSELLKKFPNAMVYMQKAKNVKAPRGLTTGKDKSERLMPIFQAKIDPEIAFFGFPITAEEARGSATAPGWFFMVQERPGEPRFGLDLPAEEEKTAGRPAIKSWNDLSWEDVKTDESGYLLLRESAFSPLPPEKDSEQQYRWNYNSAHTAAILLQLPFRVAVHATDMLKIPENNA